MSFGPTPPRSMTDGLVGISVLITTRGTGVPQAFGKSSTCVRLPSNMRMMMALEGLRKLAAQSMSRRPCFYVFGLVMRAFGRPLTKMGSRASCISLSKPHGIRGLSYANLIWCPRNWQQLN